MSYQGPQPMVCQNCGKKEIVTDTMCFNLCEMGWRPGQNSNWYCSRSCMLDKDPQMAAVWDRGYDETQASGHVPNPWK